MEVSERLLEKAIRVTVNAHIGQMDKGGHPYILHPLRVMNNCETLHTKIVGVLHDVIEDTAITLEYLKHEGFPDEILAPLDLLTHKENQSYLDGYISGISKNSIAKKVKIHDIIDNSDINRLQSITEKDLLRIKKYHTALEILRNS